MEIRTDLLAQYAGKPQLVVHCAGSGSVGRSMQDPQRDLANSVGTLSELLEYLRVFSPNSAVIFPSSAAVYGGQVSLPISEESQPNPISVYGSHKLMAETLCKSYAYNFGLSISVVRFFSVYGEGLKKQLLWDACSKYKRGDRNFLGTGKEVRDWIHIDDAVQIVTHAIERCSTDCLVVNGGSGVGQTVNEVLAQLYCALGGALVPRFTGESREGDPTEYCADISALESWGWRPDIQLHEGIQRYAMWYTKSQL